MLRFDFGGPPLLTSGVLELTLSDHTTYGLRVGYNAGRHLEPEIEWSHTRTRLENTGTPLVGGNQFPDGFKLDYALAGATYNFGRGATRAYASVGLGVARMSPTFSFDGIRASDCCTSTRFTAGVGLGVKAFATRTLGFRADVRAYATRTRGLGFGPICTTFDTTDPKGPVVPVNSTCGVKPWLVNAEGTGGLIVAF